VTRMFASDPGCKGATVGRSGRRYDADCHGFVHVDAARDVEAMKAAGYVPAGFTPATSRAWVCVCGWRALINHCPRCDRADLERTG
jgi:hypothetical protein